MKDKKGVRMEIVFSTRGTRPTIFRTQTTIRAAANPMAIPPAAAATKWTLASRIVKRPATTAAIAMR